MTFFLMHQIPGGPFAREKKLPVVAAYPPVLAGEMADYDDYRFINFVTGMNSNDTMSPSMTCALFFNGSSAARSGPSTVVNGTENVVFTPAEDGMYKWWINCTDLAGNTAGSAVYSVKMNPPEMMSVISPEETTYETNEGLNVSYYIFFEPGDLVFTTYLLDGEVDEDININQLDPSYSVLHGRYEAEGTFSVDGWG